MTPTCGAKAKSTGKPCQLYPCKNGRCHLHGGKSTGHRTKEGKRRHREAVTKHGFYSKEALAERKALRAFIKQAEQLI